MASTSTERTPLTSTPNPAPAYVFESSRIRIQERRVRNFQCCLCATIIASLILAVLITVSIKINEEPEPPIEPTTTTTIIPENLVALSTQELLTQTSWPRTDAISNVTFGKLKKEDIEGALEVGTEALALRERYEALYVRQLPMDSPSYRHQKSVATTATATDLARSGFAADASTQELVNKLNIPRTHDQYWSIRHYNVSDQEMNNTFWWPTRMCNNEKTVCCKKILYRSINGTCNNLHHRSWGAAFINFRRAIPPAYADGVSIPRRAVDGGELPSAREVSVVIHRPEYRDDPKFTVMLAIWGQFLDHDITATALSQGQNGTTISCCDSLLTPGLKVHPECYPVRLSAGDPYYHNYNLTCMEFVRSAPAATCTLGPREQMNQATSYIDGSVIYGSEEKLVQQLREYKNGRLRMLIVDGGRELLPVSTDPADGCNQAEAAQHGRYCFLSGDARANENLHLTTMHLLWARQHNRIAKQLKKQNPKWNDEKLFQESRRIISAQLQHINYNEFLPVILGPRIMEKSQLQPSESGYYSGYSETVDASIANEFAAAAFRFAHTLLPGLIKKLANATSTPEYIELHQMLFNPFDLYSTGGMDGALRGAMQTHLEVMDPYFTKELKQHLFQRNTWKTEDYHNINTTKKPAAPCGLDLVSLNIQRGRDHGLPAYPYWRKHCGFKQPLSFDDLQDVIDDNSLRRIKSIYKNVNDIDLYTGALSEIPREGGMLGATVTCIITDQFIRLKRGDRFWYETPEQPQAFTMKQLDEIRKTSLASIICDNSDNITLIQPLVMLHSGSSKNKHVPCKELPAIDFSHWKEL